MTRPGADLRKAELLEKLSDIAGMKVDAESLGDDPLEIDAPPPDDAIFLTVRASLDDLRELGQLLLRQARLGTLRPVVDQALRTRGVEAMHPVAQGLPIHAADLGCSSSVHPVPDRRQRQKPPALVDVLRPARKRPKLLSRIILSQSDR
jgi:hypothetical protein